MASSKVGTIGRKELKPAIWKTSLTLSDAEQITSLPAVRLSFFIALKITRNPALERYSIFSKSIIIKFDPLSIVCLNFFSKSGAVFESKRPLILKI